MSSGSSNSSILNMPDYGQGLAEALKAQTDALSGKLTGTPLQQIVERYERPLRMSAAQIDNDVLRQTLLGGQVPIYKSVSSDDLVERRVSQPGEGGQVTQIDYGGAVTKDGRVITGDTEIDPRWAKLRADLADAGGDLSKMSDALYDNREVLREVDVAESKGYFQAPMIKDPGYNRGDPDSVMKGLLIDLALTGKTNAVDSILDNYGKPEPIYKKNEDGTDFVVPKDENGDFILEATNETEIPEGGVAAPAGELTGYTRAGTGLVDMLGDTRNVQEFTTRQATEEDVAAGLASEVGESITEASGNRQSGFDADGNFLGLAAMAEDIQRGNLSRQREADLADVERLSSRFQTVMEDYKPGTTSGLDDARLLLEQQRENLTGLRKATQADVDAGNASEVGELFQTGSGQGGPISMPNALDPQNYGMSGDAAIGTDTLRSALLADAKSALGDGLSDRETRAIQNSARARSGLMGRTFDQSGAIEESKALIQEDNNRRMQNRAFAQSALGQEATIQQGDVSRAMTTDQFNVGAKMDAERLNESLRQQGLGNYINAVGNLAQIEDKYTLDPFQAILGRAGGGSLQAGQSVFGQAGYGLQSGPQYMNPEAGLGYISSMAANQANMYAANQAADATRSAGMMNMFGGIIGGLGGGLLAGR